MSLVRRVLSGSLASWTKIGLNVAVQIALVPVYLSHWSLEQYGCWLVIQAIGPFVNVLSVAHHNYVGNEMLRVPGNSATGISRLLSSALPFSIGWGALEVAVVAALAGSGLIEFLFQSQARLPADLLFEANFSLVLLCTSTYLSVCVSGVFSRCAYAIGQFPRAAWWGVGVLVTTSLAPVAAVVTGHGLLVAAASHAIVSVCAHVAFCLDLMRVGHRRGVKWEHADWRLGWRNFRSSVVLGAASGLGLVRQQGLRVLVGSVLGVAQAVAFATMRTASNLSLQGIATVVDPMFPEFMGFVRERNRPAIVGSFAFLWLVIVFAMGPLLVLLQAVAPWLFALWTRGQVPYDPWVFGAFSAALLVFALARPADALLLGHNRSHVQLGIAAFAALATVGGVITLDGRAGLPGVAGLLLAIEVAVAALAIHRASALLREINLQWPTALFRFALAQVVVCIACMAWMAGHPADRAAAVSLAMLIGAGLLAGFLTQLPSAHRQWLTLRLVRVCRLERTR